MNDSIENAIEKTFLQAIPLLKKQQMFIDPEQNIWYKVKKSSNIGQE